MPSYHPDYEFVPWMLSHHRHPFNRTALRYRQESIRNRWVDSQVDTSDEVPASQKSDDVKLESTERAKIHSTDGNVIRIYSAKVKRLKTRKRRIVRTSDSDSEYAGTTKKRAIKREQAVVLEPGIDGIPASDEAEFICEQMKEPVDQPASTMPVIPPGQLPSLGWSLADRIKMRGRRH